VHPPRPGWFIRPIRPIRDGSKSFAHPLPSWVSQPARLPKCQDTYSFLIIFAREKDFLSPDDLITQSLIT